MTNANTTPTTGIDFDAQLAAITPANAKAVLVATEVIDDCDFQTDYHGHKTGRQVVLCFSKSGRVSFKEMRKAALLLDETTPLATADKDAEHRENYSMGGGYYLKNEYRHATGWQVKKILLKWGTCGIRGAELDLVA